MSINQVAEKIEAQETEAKGQIYQAIGVVTGILNISDSKKPTLLIGEHTYRVLVNQRAFWKHQPGESKSFLTYPKVIDGKLGFALLWVKSQSPETNIFTLSGCWEEEDNQSHLKIYRNQISSNGNSTSLPLIWDDCPSADGQYWEIEAELCGDSFRVVSAIGPFDPPQKFYGKEEKKKSTVIKSDVPRPMLKGSEPREIKSDVPRPTLKGAEPREIKSDLPPPILKSAKTSIAALAPEEIQASAQASANEPPEAEPITETASEPIAIGTSGEIEENNIEAKAIDVSEGIASSEIKAIVETASELIAESPSESIEPVETEGSPIVAEPVTPKRKKAGSKSTASKKLSITEGASEAIAPENTEAKKTKEKAKSSSSKKQTGASATRLSLGKQLPPGK
jgi:hypothetical protein